MALKEQHQRRREGNGRTWNWAANVSILWPELPFLERFEAAAEAGFDAVELWWPEGVALDALRTTVAETGVEVALLNFDGGDLARGDRGLCNDPAREGRFLENVPVAIELAAALGCTQLNALVGIELPGVERHDQLVRAAANVRTAARAAAARGMRVLIEAINTKDNGPALVHRTDQAADFVRLVGEPNVALQYDVFHMQRMEGDLAATLTARRDEIAHVQLADAPGRGQPGTGEICFEYLFRVLDAIDYGGWVGLEYRPTTATTEASFAWMDRRSA